MTAIAKTAASRGLIATIADRIWAGYARLSARRRRRLARIELNRWSCHMLRDIGLAD